MKTVNVELADRAAHEIEQLVRAGRFAAVALYSAVSNRQSIDESTNDLRDLASRSLS